MTREEILKKLRSDPLYRSALSAAKNDADRRAISSTVESLVTTLVESLTPALINATKEAIVNKREETSDPAVVIVESKG